MGGNQSSVSGKELLENDPNYMKIALRAQQMSISITFQGDGSLSLQNTKQQNLAKDVRNVSPPIDRTDIPRCLKELSSILDEMSQNSGNLHYGYQ